MAHGSTDGGLTSLGSLSSFAGFRTSRRSCKGTSTRCRATTRASPPGPPRAARWCRTWCRCWTQTTSRRHCRRSGASCSASTTGPFKIREQVPSSAYSGPFLERAGYLFYTLPARMRYNSESANVRTAWNFVWRNHLCVSLIVFVELVVKPKCDKLSH